jgi:hypothetical protein
MIHEDLAVFFDRSIEPPQANYTEAGGSAYVTGVANPMAAAAALRFTDESPFLAPRIIAQLPEPIRSQFRISLRAYNNAHVESGVRGARLRFGMNEIGLITSEARVAATITFKQDNTIQAKGDLPGSDGALLALPIALQTEYRVDVVVNVDLVNGFSYQYDGAGMTLAPGAYHVFVDGELLPGMPADGLPFALAAGSDYAAWVGVNGGAIDLIGFVSATADTGVDWFFSDMHLHTGASIDYDPDGIDPDPDPGASIILFDELNSFFTDVAPAAPAADNRVEVVPQEQNPIGTGAGLRWVNNSASVLTRAIGTLTAPLAEPFRVRIDAFNNTLSGGNTAGARFRVGNAASGGITAEARVPLTLTFRNDNRIQAKYASAGAAVTLSQAIPAGEVVTVDLVVNTRGSEAFTYRTEDGERGLNPESFDVWVNGGLLTGSPVGGFAFHRLAGGAGGDFVPGSIDQLGWFGSSTETGADWVFDNVILHTGANIHLDGMAPVTVEQYFGAAAASAGNWRAHTGFGWLETAAFPWIYHAQHGWLEAVGAGGELWTFHDAALGWWSVLPEHAAYLFVHAQEKWLYCDPLSHAPERWFYAFDTQSWFMESP